jgi:hypothetical protein
MGHHRFLYRLFGARRSVTLGREPVHYPSRSADEYCCCKGVEVDTQLLTALTHPSSVLISKNSRQTQHRIGPSKSS